MKLSIADSKDKPGVRVNVKYLTAVS